jgi:hypothetical protein
MCQVIELRFSTIDNTCTDLLQAAKHKLTCQKNMSVATFKFTFDDLHASLVCLVICNNRMVVRDYSNV